MTINVTLAQPDIITVTLGEQGPPGPTGPAGPPGASAGAAVTVIATSGASQAMTFAATGDKAYDITVSQALALSLSGGTAGQFQRLVLIIKNPSGYPVTLPSGANIKYAGGIAPAVGTGFTVITFGTDDASTTIFGGL